MKHPTAVDQDRSSSEVVAATAQLRQLWTQMGAQTRQADAAARAVFPLYGHRPRTKATISAVRAWLRSLAPAERAIVEAASRTKAQRKAVNRAASKLAGGDLSLAEALEALDHLPPGRCSEFRAIVGRWAQQVDDIGGPNLEDTTSWPSRDEAKRLELDRQAVALIRQARGHGGVR